MGAIGEAIAAYAQPLIDQTDGSLEQVQKAFALSQLCWNLALLSTEQRERDLREMRPTLPMMDDAEFDSFRRSIIVPMIERHQQMFPRLHDRSSTPRPHADFASPAASSTNAPPAEKYLGTERYAPCPCNSGKKYKFCCGAKTP